MKIFKRSFRWLALLILASTLLVLGTTQRAFAAGVVGNGTPASCTEAAFDAVLASQTDNLTFNCGSAVKTILLTTTKAIDWQIVINGGNKIILQAKNVPHFDFTPQKFYILKNITLSKGKALNGGAILNGGTLELTKVNLENNRATFNGGAIHNTGTLTISKSSFTNNRATYAGGAIHNYGGAVTITNSTFTTNKVANADENALGGAIYTEGGVLNVQGGTFTKNSASRGSAVHKTTGQLTVKGTKFTENKASVVGTIFVANDPSFFQDILVDHNTALTGGGIASYGATTILSSTISNNRTEFLGGGLAIAADQDEKLVLANSTISGNTSGNGGGLFIGSTFELTNSTISNNRATQDGGGVWSYGFGNAVNTTLSGNEAGAHGGAWAQAEESVDFTFMTFANNKAKKGGGIFVDAIPPGQLQSNPFAASLLARRGASKAISSIQQVSLHIQNSLFAANSGGNCKGTPEEISTRGNNLSDDASCQNNFTMTSDLHKTPAKLGPLANNGGPTFTHMPGKGSKAIDGGANLLAYQIDQRAYSRPFNGTSDIGAVEAGSSKAEN